MWPLWKTFWSFLKKLNTSKDLNIRPGSVKLLEVNIGRTLFDLNRSKILFALPPRVMEIKTKINKWDLIELKNFCTEKKSINKMKRQLTEWEKTFANDGTNNRVISRIHKQLIQLNIKETTQARKKKRKKRQSI